jgi:hypothetical protein
MITIENVKCTLDSKGKLVCQIPPAMDGIKFKQWQLKYRKQAIDQLTKF